MVMHTDPITKQTFSFASPISCGRNLQKVFVLHPDNDEDYALNPKPA